MKIKMLFPAILFFVLNVHSQRNALRKIVGVHQLDKRFTFSVEKFWSGISDEESYYIYVTNNTADEYVLEIEFDLTLNCYDVKPRKLGTNGKVYLKPYGEQRYEGHYMITSDREKQKSCLIAEGDTYTLYRSHSWQILSSKNLSKEKATQNQKDSKNPDKLVFKETTNKVSGNSIKLPASDSDSTVFGRATLDDVPAGETVARHRNDNSAKMPKQQASETISIKVFKQDGKYYIQKDNGKIVETSQSVFDVIQQAVAR